MNEVLAEKTNPAEFISEYKQFLQATPRSPYELQLDTEFIKDFEQVHLV